MNKSLEQACKEYRAELDRCFPYKLTEDMLIKKSIWIKIKEWLKKYV